MDNGYCITDILSVSKYLPYKGLTVIHHHTLTSLILHCYNDGCLAKLILKL